jgi:hypothetical protein
MFVHPELSFISLMVTPLLPIKLPACVAQINILHAICYVAMMLSSLNTQFLACPNKELYYIALSLCHLSMPG